MKSLFGLLAAVFLVPAMAEAGERHLFALSGQSNMAGLKPESAAEEDPFEELIEQKKHERGVELDTEVGELLAGLTLFIARVEDPEAVGVLAPEEQVLCH